MQSICNNPPISCDKSLICCYLHQSCGAVTSRGGLAIGRPRRSHTSGLILSTTDSQIETGQIYKCIITNGARSFQYSTKNKIFVYKTKKVICYHIQSSLCVNTDTATVPCGLFYSLWNWTGSVHRGCCFTSRSQKALLCGRLWRNVMCNVCWFCNRRCNCCLTPEWKDLNLTVTLLLHSQLELAAPDAVTDITEPNFTYLLSNSDSLFRISLRPQSH